MKRWLSLILIATIIFAMTPIMSIKTSAAGKTPTVYSQLNDTSAFNYPGGSGSTYKSSGCGVYSIVNAVKYLTGKKIDPHELGNFAISCGGRVNGGITHDFCKKVANSSEFGGKYGFKLSEYYTFGSSSNKITCGSQVNSGYPSSAQWNTLHSKLIEHLSKGEIAVVLVLGHFMSIVDYDSSTGKFLMLDSAPYKSKRLSDNGLYQWVTADQLNSNTNKGKPYIQLRSVITFLANTHEPDISQNPDDYSVPTRDIYYKSSGTMTGSDVSWIQAVLYQLGYSIDIDGSFGPSAKKIVEQFQKDNGLTVDGSCGPATRSKLKELWNQKKNATYSFTYNANGGTGETKPFTVKYNQDFTIVNNSCGKSGYHFGGWGVKRNNDNKWYVAGVGWCSEDTISKNGYSKKNYSNNLVCTLDNSWTRGLKAAGSYTFYATWIKDPITISFNANGGTGTMSTITTEFGKEYTFPDCQFKKEEYIFEGWNVYRVNDGKWISEGHGWLTESDIKNQGYSKRIYYEEDTKIFDDSWKNGCSDENIQYIAYAVWKACSHQYKLVSQTASTCTSDGTKKYTCSQCDKSYSETIPAKGHTVVTVTGKAATCTSTGLTDGSKCSVCGAVIKAQQTIPAKGHSFGNWTVTKAATCNGAGTENRTCSVCKYTESRTIPAKGHTIVTIPGKAAICTSTGLTDGSKCSVCGTVVKAQEVIPMTSHNYVEKIIAPTETAQGYTLHTCSVCGNSYKDNYTEYVSTDKPQIIVESKKASAGNIVDVTIAVKNNPGIASMKLRVAYSKDLTLTQVTYNDSIGGNAQQPQTMNSPVTLNWYNGAENSTGDWIFATLTFKVSNDAANGNVNDIVVTYADDDIYDITEENIKFDVQNGSVDIISYLPGDINSDGKVNNKDLTRLFQYLSDWDVEVNEAALDVNGDGKINNKDLTRLFQCLSDWNVEIF